jgi:hypothetical protein
MLIIAKTPLPSERGPPAACIQPVSQCVHSAKALSRYSDMVDAMWRQQRELLDVASDDARLKLRQWELPEALQVDCRSINTWSWLAKLRAQADMLSCYRREIRLVVRLAFSMLTCNAHMRLPDTTRPIPRCRVPAEWCVSGMTWPTLTCLSEQPLTRWACLTSTLAVGDRRRWTRAAAPPSRRASARSWSASKTPAGCASCRIWSRRSRCASCRRHTIPAVQGPPTVAVPGVSRRAAAAGSGAGAGCPSGSTCSSFCTAHCQRGTPSSTCQTHHEIVCRPRTCGGWRRRIWTG